MKLTIIGNPDEISKLIQLFTERDDETEEIEETYEIGFLAEKSPTAIGQNNSLLKNSSRRIIAQWSALVQKLMVE